MTKRYAHTYIHTYIHTYYNCALLQKIYLTIKRALREKSVPQGALLLFFERRVI